MAVKPLSNPLFISVKPNGSPNSLGTVGVYVAGTSFVTPATIWDTQTKDVALPNPVTLSSDGTKEIWYDVLVDIQVKDSDGNVIDQALNLDPNVAVDSTGNFNLVVNGSFEIDTDADGAPDNWTLATDSGGTIAIDATSGGQTHGVNGLKFTGTGSGAGTATSQKFDVLSGSVVVVEFSYKTSAATTTNTVTINWYKFDSSSASTANTVVHTLSSGNPTSWTGYLYGIAIPSDAVRAEIIIAGVSSGGTDKTGPTWFDDIKVTQLSSTTKLIDLNGLDVLLTSATTSAVNEITATNAATGNKPSLNQTGADDVGIDAEGVELKNGAINGGVSTANYTRSNTIYVHDDSADSVVFDLTLIGTGGWETVGPTGSGATNIWTALDALPASVVNFIEVKIDNFVENTGNSAEQRLFARVGGSSTGLSNRTQVSIAKTTGPAATDLSDGTSALVKIPIDSSGILELVRSVTGTSFTMDMYLTGFGI